MINSILNSLLQVLTLTPLAVIARKSDGNKKSIFLILAALIFVVTSVANGLLSSVILFEGQKWNWIGKSFSLVIAMAFICFYKPLTLRDFGISLKIEWTNSTRILMICVAYFLLRVVLFFASTNGNHIFDPETILFQATLPGLVEEIVFRGILLTMLNHVFTKSKWNFAKVPFGWATVITSLLFGLVHGFYLDNNYHFHFNVFDTARTAFEGFLFALLVEKTRNIIPAILFHNILNLIGTH